METQTREIHSELNGQSVAVPFYGSYYLATSTHYVARM